MKRTTARTTLPEGFDEFWATYPRKIAKGAARTAFARALKLTDLETIMAGTKRYAALRAGQDPQFTCHASTWLNQERWTDEHDTALAMSRRGQAAVDFTELRRWYERNGMHVPMKLRH